MTKDEAAQELISWHFQIEPEIVEIYRFITSDEGNSQEPISLLEVSNATMTSGRVVPFGFAKTEEIPYPTVIATITPEEMEKIREQQMSLPTGWDLGHAERHTPTAVGNGVGRG